MKWRLTLSVKTLFMRYFLVFVLFTAVSCSQKFYVVRHAEKAVQKPDTDVMFDASNPPLSEAGNARAQLLKRKFSNKRIKHIFSTRYERNIATARPLANAKKLQIQVYSPMPDSLESIIEKLKSITKGNVLVIAHSNTVDDLINKFTGEEHIPEDLKDHEYDNLFIITRKKGKLTFTREKFGDSGGDKK